MNAKTLCYMETPQPAIIEKKRIKYQQHLFPIQFNTKFILDKVLKKKKRNYHEILQ